MAQYSKRVREAAETLVRLVETERAGETWTWGKIGEVLSLNHRQAKQVVYYLRETSEEFIWTVGVVPDYETMPTRSTRDAASGFLNQNRHLHTRVRSMARVCRVLHQVDPDPRWSRVMGRNAGQYERMAADIRDIIDDFGERLSDMAT